MKNLYRVRKKRKHFEEVTETVYVIEKLRFFGLFYLPTAGYYYNKKIAQEVCDTFNTNNLG